MVSFVPLAPSMRTSTFLPGLGPQSGLVQCPADDLDVVGGSIRARVTGPQHDHRALTGPLAGAVVEPGG